MEKKKHYTLQTTNGSIRSEVPGLVGGHRGLRIYGRLDCPSALRWIKMGHYANRRVFFADVETATKCGYRPCSICMPELYRIWKAVQSRNRTPIKTLCTCCKKKLNLFWPDNCVLNGNKVTKQELIGHALRSETIWISCDSCLLKIPEGVKIDDVWLA